jgi:PST family polysaccharide transporter
LGAEILEQTTRTLDSFLIGWRLEPEDLGLYTLVYFLVTIPQIGVGGLLSQVGLSAFSRIQDDNRRLGEGFLLATRVVLLVSAPVLVVISVGSKAVVEVLTAIWGSQWDGGELPLSILAVMGFINAATGTPGLLWIAKGRADVRFLWYSLMVVTIGVATLIGVQWGLAGVCVALTIRSAIFFLFPPLITRRLVGLSLGRYFGSLLPHGAATVILWLLLWPLARWGTLGGLRNPLLLLPAWGQAALLLAGGAAVYLLILRVFQPGSWKEIGRIVKISLGSGHPKEASNE